MALHSRGLCLRCLTRALPSETAPSTSSTLQRAAFSTTHHPQANPPKKKNAAQTAGSKRGKSLRLGKNTRTSSGRPPAPGERKALRKRVVLSNTNALEVRGLQDFSTETIARLRELQGTVLGLDASIEDSTADALRALEAFKPTQGWNLFWRPATVVRQATAEMGERLGDVEEGKSVMRRILSGERGSGKSVLQLQGMAMAYLKGWIVIHMPEGKDLTNAHTAYEPSPSDPSLYLQPDYTALLLSNLLKANRTLLSTLRLTQTHNLPIPIQPNISLAGFAELGARDPDLAYPIWAALLTELTTPSNPSQEGQQRPPLWLSLDGADHCMRHSAYLNADSKPLHAHDLALVRDFTAFLSGSRQLPNGGAVVAAVSQSNRAAAPTLDHNIALNLARQAGTEGDIEPWNPYIAADAKVQAVMDSGVEVQQLGGLSKEEARGVMEYYAQSGLLRANVTQGLVGERWTLSGGGVVGELERGSVGLRF